MDSHVNTNKKHVQIEVAVYRLKINSHMNTDKKHVLTEVEVNER